VKRMGGKKREHVKEGECVKRGIKRCMGKNV
jgi:hypothetical protein